MAGEGFVAWGGFRMRHIRQPHLFSGPVSDASIDMFFILKTFQKRFAGRESGARCSSPTVKEGLALDVYQRGSEPSLTVGLRTGVHFSMGHPEVV